MAARILQNEDLVNGVHGRHIAGGYGNPPAMTDPNDDLSSIADPGSMGADAMTEPDSGNPGDLEFDHEQLAADRQSDTPGAAADSPGVQGTPVGPPD
jgi:hypothetical protein